MRFGHGSRHEIKNSFGDFSCYSICKVLTNLLITKGVLQVGNTIMDHQSCLSRGGAIGRMVLGNFSTGAPH